jgi:hypothetical protein
VQKGHLGGDGSSLGEWYWWLLVGDGGLSQDNCSSLQASWKKQAVGKAHMNQLVFGKIQHAYYLGKK